MTEAMTASPPPSTRLSLRSILATGWAALRRRPVQVLGAVAAYTALRFALDWLIPWTPSASRQVGQVFAAYVFGGLLSWSLAAVLAYQVVAATDGRRGWAEAVAAGVRAGPLVVAFSVVEALLPLPNAMFRNYARDSHMAMVEIASWQIAGSLVVALVALALSALMVLAIPAAMDRRLSALRGFLAGLGMARARWAWMTVTLLALFFATLAYSVLLVAPLMLVPYDRPELGPMILEATEWVRFGVRIITLLVMGLFWPAAYLEMRRRAAKAEPSE
jgi:hypothetical protein